MQETVCRNVFKGGRSTVTAQEFTRVWIALVQRLERSRAILSRVE